MNETKNIINIVGKNSNFNVKNFDTLEEFQSYYNLHKDEIDKLSTVKLNRMFKIKDHKITRRTIDNAETKTLCFRQLLKSEMERNSAASLTGQIDEHVDCHENIVLSVREIENTISELNNRIKVLELDNLKIKNQLLEIIKVINGGA